MKIRRLTVVLLASVALAGCGDETSPQPGCNAQGIEGIAVAETDVYGGVPYALGYPPYAIDGCRLAYVSTGGDLVLRDLERGTESTLASAGESPRRPALSGEDVAWEATLGGLDVVRVGRAGQEALTVQGPFDRASEPRVAQGSLVLTGWLGADTDVYLYDIARADLTVIAAGPGQQRFADISPTHITWTDFAEDPTGTFDDEEDDVANVVLMDRASGSPHTFEREGKQAFGTLSGGDDGGKLVVLDWGLVHPEPKFSGYTILMADVAGDNPDFVTIDMVTTKAPYLRPAARGAWLEWVGSSDGNPALFRRPTSLDVEATVVSAFPGLTVFGPSAAEGITLVGAADGGAVTLRAFDRPRP